MRILPLFLLTAVCLSGCATHLTLNSPPIPDELRQPCAQQAAKPLTTGDQYDLARALAEANSAFKDCRARHAALLDAVNTRKQVLHSIKKQVESGHE